MLKDLTAVEVWYTEFVQLRLFAHGNLAVIGTLKKKKYGKGKYCIFVCIEKDTGMNGQMKCSSMNQIFGT